jgi:thiamine-monophosphate kinase
VTLGEFDLIERFFSRPSRRGDVLLGVGDDAALLSVPAGQVLVAATDTLVEGRHFLTGAPARSVGHQVLAVNLSDLAAMGADPAWALLSLSMPTAEQGWLQEFADGLYALAERFEVALVGGDTVRGPLVATIELLGFVEPELALRRSGARPGDRLYVSGWPGEAAAGLDALRQGLASPDGDDPLVRRYLFAEPRIELGRALRGRASAAMDVSDGLLGDLAKLCVASRVGAKLRLEALPVSGRLSAQHGRAACEQYVLHGGDDYELLFTVPATEAERFERELRAVCPVTHIGEITAGGGIECLRNGASVAIGAAGYDHFA